MSDDCSLIYLNDYININNLIEFNLEDIFQHLFTLMIELIIFILMNFYCLFFLLLPKIYHLYFIIKFILFNNYLLSDFTYNQQIPKKSHKSYKTPFFIDNFL